MVNRLPTELPIERKIELLLLWKRQKGNFATNYVLLTALYQCGSDTSLLQTAIDVILFENASDVSMDVVPSSDEERAMYDESKSDYDALKVAHNALKSDYAILKSNYDSLKIAHVSLKSEYDRVVENKRPEKMKCIEQDGDPERGVPSIDVSSSLVASASSTAEQPVLVVSCLGEIGISEDLFDCSQKSEHSCASPNAPTLVVDSLDLEYHSFGYLPAGSKRSFSQSDES